MKKRRLLIPLLTLSAILIFTLLPLNFLSANPVNLVKNGDFSGGLTDWAPTPGIGGSINVADGKANIQNLTPQYAYILQDITTSKKNLIFSCDVWPVVFDINTDIFIRMDFWDGANSLGTAEVGYSGFPLNVRREISFKISDAWRDSQGTDLPDFTFLTLDVGIYGSWVNFDNISLSEPGVSEAEPVWIRDSEMKCKQIWINEENKFQFSFIYPYRDNNWVKIYDMSGKEVFSIDMPYDNPNIIVGLPNGMYTVKTFHDQIEPIQEFIIGKP